MNLLGDIRHELFMIVRRSYSFPRWGKARKSENYNLTGNKKNCLKMYLSIDSIIIG